jgi:hypothetical protein
VSDTDGTAVAPPAWHVDDLPAFRQVRTWRIAMLSLKGFHLFFILVSIVLAAGFGTWCLQHQYLWTGLLSLTAGLVLIGYEGYFVGKAERTHIG